jgi:hypothetical protein
VALATRESRLGITASWVSLLGSFVLSFATWVALGQLTGYGKLAFCLALCVDGYIVSALVTWMAPVSDKIATVAKVNTWIAAVIGVTAQSAYHGLTIWTQTESHWRAVLATAVGALPPLGAAGSVHMRAMVRRNSLQLAAPASRTRGRGSRLRIRPPLSRPYRHRCQCQPHRPPRNYRSTSTPSARSGIR